jgi:hypothetical protein
MILPLARFFYIQHDTQPLDEMAEHGSPCGRSPLLQTTKWLHFEPQIQPTTQANTSMGSRRRRKVPTPSPLGG